MREIKYIVIHCTATPQSATVASIQRYWREVLKWKIGGVDANGKPIDNRTDAQKETLLYMVKRWAAKYPAAKIMGHRDFSRDLNRDGILQPGEWSKACPSFDVKEWCEQVGLKHNR